MKSSHLGTPLENQLIANFRSWQSMHAHQFGMAIKYERRTDAPSCRGIRSGPDIDGLPYWALLIHGRHPTVRSTSHTPPYLCKVGGPDAGRCEGKREATVSSGSARSASEKSNAVSNK